MTQQRSDREFMGFVLTVSLLLLLATSGTSCSKPVKSNSYEDFLSRSMRAERDFCSTNIDVAESGLLSYRLWLLDQKTVNTTNYYDAAISEADSELFLLYEIRGETNRAERFYKEAVEARMQHLRNIGEAAKPISKDALRAELSRQKQGQTIGWMNKETVTPNSASR